ncbi:RNA 2',3'-cyclic phosphodiesterase [Balneatrix alpica]|uniref:RNA 2',3'-cyclic phosphodiesterase n=1 Tax=Balneatrix alpica TaxID=75684 RepID=A0ABV5Z838_9GAMM|nr:RNA 2',3'-cyclic phosphodiesterase [Balneatrix alpica]
MSVQRIFIALPVPPELGQLWLSQVPEVLEGVGALNLQPLANLHLTLAFLGDWPLTQQQVLQQSLAQVCRQHSPFTLTVSQLGGWQLSAKRELWVAWPERSLPLLNLQQQLNQSCQQLGWVASSQTYRPHITLARYRGQAHSEVEKPLAAASWRVDQVIIYRSDLGQQNSIYTPLASLPLAGKALE